MAGVKVEREQGATFVELFFDLVFVFALTQLTSLVLHDLTWAGAGKAAVLFWLVWWAWTQFTWTLNLADTEHVWVRVPTLAATAVAFFLAQSVPDALGSAGAWFAVTYAIGRLIGIAIQTKVIRSGGDVDDGSLLMFTLPSLVGIGLVLAGGFADPDVRLWFWLAAFVSDLATVAFAGKGTWELRAGHFAERHGLIVIIALGESLIAAGVATGDLERDATFLFATSGAVVAACALWWTYFGALHAEFEHKMAAIDIRKAGAFARDVFSLSHALIVAGVVGIAVGFEEAIAHPDHALEGPAALALTLGVLLFVGGMTISSARAGLRSAVGPRITLIVLVLAATPIIPKVAAGVTLWSLAAGAIALAIWETRHIAKHEPVAAVA